MYTTPRILIRTMATYCIGAIEAQWLLSQPIEETQTLSTGKIIWPYQGI